MNKLLFKFDDFIDGIEERVSPVLRKAISFIFMPRSITDAFIRWFVLLLAIISIYLITYIPVNNGLSENKIFGKINALEVARYGSGNIRFSGNSEIYYFKIDGYRSTFYINNMGSFLGNGSLSRWMFEKGNKIETTISKNDYARLFKGTPLPSVKDSVFPDDDDCILVYGITVNGQKINSKYASLFSVSYFNNFSWLIPLYIYFIVLTLIIGIMIQATYSDWKAGRKNNQ